jgi:hypothetical protein
LGLWITTRLMLVVLTKEYYSLSSSHIDQAPKNFVVTTIY